MDGEGKIYIKSYLRKVTYNKTVIFLVPLKISSYISFWPLLCFEKEPHMHTPKTSKNKENTYIDSFLQITRLIIVDVKCEEPLVIIT